MVVFGVQHEFLRKGAIMTLYQVDFVPTRGSIFHVPMGYAEGKKSLVVTSCGRLVSAR